MTEPNASAVLTPCVHIRIIGKKLKSGPEDRLPKCRDLRIMRRFNHLVSNDVGINILHINQLGGGVVDVLVTPKVAEKIKKWLKEQPDVELFIEDNND